MYTIRYSPNNRRLHLRLVGHWDESTFESFAAEYKAALDQYAGQDRPLYILSDSREFPVQSQVVAEKFNTLSALSSRHAHATAIVVGSVLNKMQVNRTMPSDRVRAFLDIQDAEDWLSAQMTSAAA